MKLIINNREDENIIIDTFDQFKAAFLEDKVDCFSDTALNALYRAELDRLDYSDEDLIIDPISIREEYVELSIDDIDNHFWYNSKIKTINDIKDRTLVIELDNNSILFSTHSSILYSFN